MNTSIKKSLFMIAAAIILAAPLLEGCANKGATDNTDPSLKTGNKAAASKPVEMFDKGNTLYTLTNLHPDPKQRLYSTNYLQPGLLPRCSAVKVVALSKKRFQFTVKDVTYLYDFNPRTDPEGFDANLKQYFGKTCASAANLSATDQKGIREGRALKGMSKKGVTYAIGYPTTPTDDNAWTYVKGKFGDRIRIEFNGAGNVTLVKD